MKTEREIRVTLLDGSAVIMNTRDRALFQASRPGAIPLAVDADTAIDDVLYALADAQQVIARQQGAWDELKSIVSTNATGGRGDDVNDYDIMLNIMGNIKGFCCSTPDVRTVNNAIVRDTSVCMSCGRLFHSQEP